MRLPGMTKVAAVLAAAASAAITTTATATTTTGLVRTASQVVRVKVASRWSTCGQVSLGQAIDGALVLAHVERLGQLECRLLFAA